MDPDKHQRLRKNHSFLKKNLVLSRVLDKLYEKGVLSQDANENIRCQSPTSKQIQSFLDHLTRTGNKGYTLFCEALEDTEQNHILDVLQETKIDKQVLGEVSDKNIFFDPSEDFELKVLLDQLTIQNKIGHEQLERMKHFVIDENGCPEEIIEKKDTTVKFFRHLMKTRLLSRYNLAFLQSLLWRVGLKALCQEVAAFARTNSQQPIHFYSPKDTAENGYSFSKIHIQGNLEHFKGTRIEDICQRVARYIGVPSSHVIIAGVEPSESIVLTLMLHNDALSLLRAMEDFAWLSDLDIDYIILDGGRITIRDQTVHDEESQPVIKTLKHELIRKLESERHLKQCLFHEQVSNELLKDQQAEQEEKLKKGEETLQELNTWYSQIFAVLLISLHFIAELVKSGRSLSGQAPVVRVLENAQSRYISALEKAKRWSSNHSSLLELVDATEDLQKTSERCNIDNMNQIASIPLVSMQENFDEALTRRWTERKLGVDPKKTPSMDEFRQETIAVEVMIGLKRLDPVFQEMVCSLVNRLSDDERFRLSQVYNVPANMLTTEMRHRIFDYIIFSELDKEGKLTVTNEDIVQIVEAALKAVKRKDLWDEFKAWNDKVTKMQRQQRESQSRKQTDINDRLDRIEKMLQTTVGQNVMGSMGMTGGAFNGTHTDMPGIPGQFLAFLKGSGAHGLQPFQQQNTPT